jgi:hypothetical protein
MNSPLPAGFTRAMSQRSGASSDPFWNRGHNEGGMLNSINVGKANEYDNDAVMREEYGILDEKNERGMGMAIPISPLPPLDQEMGKKGTGGGFSLFPNDKEKKVGGYGF